MKKRGQITIFIIVGIAIVGAVALFFILRSGLLPQFGEKVEENPNAFLTSCLEDSVKEGTTLISSQGGYISNPLNKSFRFAGEDIPTDISYLCYTSNAYETCVNQEPMLIPHLENEIKNYISEDVNECFDNLVSSLEQRGYNVNAVNNGFDVKLEERKIMVNINSEITLTKTGETTTQEDLKVIIPSRFYDLVVVVQEIVNKEAANCEFSHYDIFTYPELNIDKSRTSDSSTIYIIKNRNTEEKFKFAVRGCVIPPGFGLEFEE